MSVDGNNSQQSKLKQWALDNPNEWDVVCGFKKADIDKTLEIQKLLTEAGLLELSEMMAIRAYRLLAESDDSGT